MKKVNTKNIVTNEEYDAQMEDATDWIAKCIANNSWGRPARECPKKGLPYSTEDYLDSLVLEEFVKVVKEEWVEEISARDEYGQIVMEEYTFEDPQTGEFTTGERPVVDHTITWPEETQVWVRLDAEYQITETDITEEYALKQKIERKISTGKAVQDASSQLIQLITGDNMESGRTAEQIAQMQIDFATISALIDAGRLITAKPLIEAIDNEDYAELKADILALYALNGF